MDREKQTAGNDGTKGKSESEPVQRMDLHDLYKALRGHLIASEARMAL